MSETVKTQGVGESASDLSFSAWDMFWNADWVVQTVMLVLLMASFWSWTIIFFKTSKLRSLNAQAKKFEDAFWSCSSLTGLSESLAGKELDPMSSLFVRVMSDWQRDKGQGSKTLHSMQDRLQRLMNLSINREADVLEKHMVFLASVGSTAVFVGLFGTVWGIMNSFQGIAMSQSTNLAVVAPGIAEALLATALGLVAAIPAVLAYNKLSNEISRYVGRLEAFSDEFVALLSRQYEGAA